MTPLIDLFHKIKTVRTRDAAIKIGPKDFESYTAQNTEAFMDYKEEIYVVPQYAPKVRKEDLDRSETKTDSHSAIFDCSTSQFPVTNVSYFSESSDDLAFR